jgi:tRNA nucleotidyltransferase (CCA-adding enzyme)
MLSGGGWESMSPNDMAPPDALSKETIVTPSASIPAPGRTVITSHVNADFDAMSSMLAAQKLYPQAVVVFPGSQERNLRDFFIRSMAYLFNMVDIREVDFPAVECLVLVDTRQPGRIGPLAELLKRQDLVVHTYDHHPAAKNDITGEIMIHDLTGANTTLLVELIRQRGIAVSPDEATLMCLGIYEDTGSFNFPSTTARDLEAAAFLLTQGANINVIADMITREITPTQVSILNDMLQAAVRHHIQGVEVMVTSIAVENYLPDFAVLVHKMIRMENPDALFAIGMMENKIHIVARSRVAEVNVGVILADFGGGGHPYAAAATLKDWTLVQAEHTLVERIYANIRTRRSARDLMSSPAIMVAEDVACRQADRLLNQYSVNALLVKRREGGGANPLLGFITRQVIEKAIYHELGDVPVAEYMSTDMATVGPGADIDEIRDKIIDTKQRILPVLDESGVLGVITRTDLLNVLVRRVAKTGDLPSDIEEIAVHARTRHVGRFMRERLSARLLEMLQDIGQVAGGLGYRAYVVGGFVRDLFLYRANEDVDVVIEGDGIQFAKAYAAKVEARLHTHAKFGTAVIIFPDGFKVDVASARMEYYHSPAALPTVEMSSIKLDLFRRDFTINTLCIQLNPEKFGTLIDFFAAQKDLKEKAVRVLHNLSFVEDPTRAFRAIRFEQRFGFTIGKLTAGLIRNAERMEFFKRLSGKRVFSELRQILGEENPAASIVRLNDFNLLKVIHPSLELNDALVNLFASIKKVVSWHDLLFLEESYMKWSVYFMGLMRHLDRPATQELCRRFELAPKLTNLFSMERPAAERRLSELERRLPAEDSGIYRQLSGFRTELILFMMAATRGEAVRKAISHYCVHLRFVRPLLGGRDLARLGLTPGPVYRQVLEAILDAKLNGRLETRLEEEAFALEIARAPATRPQRRRGT